MIATAGCSPTSRVRRGSLAAAQLRAGWATVYVFEDPFEQLAPFQTAEASSRDAGRGAWRRCGGNFHTPV